MISKYHTLLSELVANDYGLSFSASDYAIEVGWFIISVGVPGNTYLVEEKKSDEPRIACRSFEEALKTACIKNAYYRFDIALGKASEQLPLPTVLTWDPEDWLEYQLAFREFAEWFSRLTPADLRHKGFRVSQLQAFRRNPLAFLTTLDEKNLDLLDYPQLPDDQMVHLRDFTAWFQNLTPLSLRIMGFSKQQIKEYLVNPFVFYLNLPEDQLGKFQYPWHI